MTTVIVYNAGGAQVLHEVSLRHAIGMLHRRVARVLEADPDATFGPYPVPRSLELVRWIYTRWIWDGAGPVPYSNEGVLRRDHRRCCYCGRTATTIDHVLPRSRGGATNWTNCVAACFDCNGRKADRTPPEADMQMLWPARAPATLAELLPRRHR